MRNNAIVSTSIFSFQCIPFEYTNGSYGGIKKTLPTLLSLFYPVGKGGMGSSLPNRDSNSNLSFLATIF